MTPEERAREVIAEAHSMTSEQMIERLADAIAAAKREGMEEARAIVDAHGHYFRESRPVNQCLAISAAISARIKELEGGEMSEFGFALLARGPFATEREAYDAARQSGAREFITGCTDAGWFWALEEEYQQLGGNKQIGIN